MKKITLIQILFLFATTFCLAQEEISTSDSTQTAPLETTEELTPAPIDTDEEVTPITSEHPDSLTPERKVRDFQLTLITPIGTNGIAAPRITNRISLNTFVGINGGLEGVELGGFANVLTQNGEGLQAAGFTNVVRGNFDGIQGAGFVNANIGRTEGIQLAGFVNYAKGGLDGVQAAGFLNVARGRSDGVQLSGYLNVAKNHDGLQLGFINIADSLSGLAIGFFSFARNGYHTLEASANETFPVNLSFKTGGNRYFYNIFSTGLFLNDVNDEYQVGFGYGVGTNWRISKRLSFNTDIISYALVPRNINGEDLDDEDFGAVGKVHFGLSFKVAKYFTVFGGPTLNGLFNRNRELREIINPIELFTVSNDDWQMIAYPGFSVGVRI